MTDFVIDPQIAADSMPVTELELSAVRLMRNANYPWLLLLPRRAGIFELVDLGPADRIALMEEIAAASAALRETVPCDKLNVASFGNAVRQMHIHVIARTLTDPAGRSLFGARRRQGLMHRAPRKRLPRSSRRV